MSVDHIFAELRPEQILYRDDALVAIDKPAGLSTVSSDGADDLIGRVRRWIAAERGVNSRSVYVGAHELLERDSSGIVLFTLDKRANRGLAAQLEAATPLRGFRVITGDDRIARSINATQKRTGAARTQLATQGTPVVGDVQHGGRADHRAMFHVETLALRHPLTQEALTINCPAPASLLHPADRARTLIDDAMYRNALLSEALVKRRSIRQLGTDQQTTAMRLIHGGADGFDGIAVDLYDRWLVLHILDDAWLPHAETFARLLHDAVGAAGVYGKHHPRQKNDLAAEEIASLAADRPVVGEAAPDPLRIVEHGVPLYVRLGDGLRTGLFLDQRDNRDRIRREASGKRVLNLFAYTCGFSAAALAGSAAHVTSVDASALVMARAVPSLSELRAGDRHRSIVGDCFDVLGQLNATGERFDLLIIDPPSYASTTSGRFRLRRDYAKLVAETVAIASPGASVLCCTNHHGTTERDLRRFALEGARQAQRSIRQSRLAAPPIDFAPRTGAIAELKSVWLDVV